MGLTLKLYYFSRPATVPRGLYGGWQAHRNKSPGWGLIGKSKAAPAQCSWYVFILGGVAIHLSVCMPAYVCVCVRAPRQIQHVYAYITSHDAGTIEWLPTGIESMFITESVSADQRLPPRQSVLFLFQPGPISCHPVTQMLLFCAT